MVNKHSLVIIGGGPAGLAAALEARKNGVEDILILERDVELGGILQQCIHNGFGLHVFKEELTGPEYAQRFITEIKKQNIKYKTQAMVINISKEKIVSYINPEDGLVNVKAKAIVLSMGCRERTRGAIAIPGTRPAGIMTAGTAQRFINIDGYMVGKKVVILGSGDIGLIMARRLTLEGAKVLGVSELMPFSGGLTRNIVQCLKDYDIPLFLSHTVTRIEGKDRVERVTLSEVDKNFKPIKGSEKTFECDTLLLSVGLIPENELSQNMEVEMDRKTSGPIVNESMETCIPGVFACGNVVHVHDLVDYVTEEAQMAGQKAAEYLNHKLVQDSPYITMEAGEGISYVIPQKLSPENIDNKTRILLRVNNVYKNAKLCLFADDKLVREVKRPHLAPGEMERINLSSNLFDAKINKLSIKVEGEKTSYAI